MSHFLSMLWSGRRPTRGLERQRLGEPVVTNRPEPAKRQPVGEAHKPETPVVQLPEENR